MMFKPKKLNECRVITVTLPRYMWVSIIKALVYMKMSYNAFGNKCAADGLENVEALLRQQTKIKN